MKVRVQFFAQLRDAIRTSETEIELKEDARVDDLLAALFARFPSLRSWSNSILVGAGVEFVKRDHVLHDGDEIAVMPPVQGG